MYFEYETALEPAQEHGAGDILATRTIVHMCMWDFFERTQACHFYLDHEGYPSLTTLFTLRNDLCGISFRRRNWGTCSMHMLYRAVELQYRCVGVANGNANIVN